MLRSLWAGLHDGTLQSVAVADGVAKLTFDVPHVRAHAGFGENARFVLRAQGSVSLGIAAWHAPSTPRPAGGDAASKAWAALGTMRSLDWDAFAASLAARAEETLRSRGWAEGLDVVEAEIDQRGDLERLIVRGSLAPTWHWVELRVEATTLTFERETGEPLTVAALEALGEAYWEAWAARSKADRSE